MKATLAKVNGRLCLEVRGLVDGFPQTKTYIPVAKGCWQSRFTIQEITDTTVTMTDDFCPGATVSLGIIRFGRD